MKVLFATGRQRHASVFTSEDENRIAATCDVMDAGRPEQADQEFILHHVADAEIVITTWGTAKLDADIAARAQNIRLVAHAAGSVKPVVSDALWERGVRVVTGAGAIAHGVAEFCLGLMLTAPGRTFWAAAGTRQGAWYEGTKAFHGPFDIYGQNVGVIGAGFVGRILISLLQNFDCNVLVFDPYCSAEDVAGLGATKVDSLDDLFSQCTIVSLNAPTTDQTRHMIRGRHFALLPDGAVFINTARGAIIAQDEMVEELRKGRFVACIDVTDPEPCALDHPLRRLPNVILTPHQAGGLANNRLRIGSFIADEIERFVNDEPLRFEVKKEDLARMA